MMNTNEQLRKALDEIAEFTREDCGIRRFIVK